MNGGQPDAGGDSKKGLLKLQAFSEAVPGGRRGVGKWGGLDEERYGYNCPVTCMKICGVTDVIWGAVVEVS